MGEEDTEIPCQAWTTKLPKASQPNLNFMGRFNTNLLLFFFDSFLQKNSNPKVSMPRATGTNHKYISARQAAPAIRV